ncbi:xanthine dehydrogenase family protein subunit M [Streptomyces sp. GMY02]|uniref:FAD binding domain-containing protein n=1 Tax=Streptomyces sp. GMY02 TaxID=1333528 RepID=UPI001C2B9C39|nr:xanthine dehydrogenase family protein subunit M [Streptomyces sp. GMY02]QXE37046.1 xanthine dehydrogenase family protein subunit M [Streptomyces sp. GMY02]
MQVPAPFEYERATSVDQAIGLLDRLGDTARLVAGGHSLLPMMKLRLANFEYLIDINDLAGELGHITVEPERIRIGALTRHRELLESAVLAETFPIFADAERVIADPVVRNRGTLGGSLCQADPSEDLSAVCTTLGASCVIQGAGGRRVVTMEEFHRGPYETAVGDAEMLIEVRFPVRPNGSSAYEKVERRAGDWAVVSAGAAVWLADSASTAGEAGADAGAAGGAGPVIADARVGLAAVGPNTTGLPEISRALRGLPPSEELYERAGTIAAASCEPVTDRRGSADYKRHLAKELTVRALRRSVARAQQARTNSGTNSGTNTSTSTGNGSTDNGTNGTGHRTAPGNGHPQGD